MTATTTSPATRDSAAPNLSPAYQRALELWDRWREANKFFRSTDGEQGLDRLDEIEDELHKAMDTSVHVLALVLMIEIVNPEDVDGLKLASLRAIRPQLVGSIAEDVDRVLAEEEEART
jgi:hypothetical protein